MNERRRHYPRPEPASLHSSERMVGSLINVKDEEDKKTLFAAFMRAYEVKKDEGWFGPSEIDEPSKKTYRFTLKGVEFIGNSDPSEPQSPKYVSTEEKPLEMKIEINNKYGKIRPISLRLVTRDERTGSETVVASVYESTHESERHAFIREGYSPEDAASNILDSLAKFG